MFNLMMPMCYINVTETQKNKQMIDCKIRGGLTSVDVTVNPASWPLQQV